MLGGTKAMNIERTERLLIHEDEYKKLFEYIRQSIVEENC